MTVQIKTIDMEPKRQTFGHVARRLGADKPATRYQEATLDVQATANFHYKPLWEPEYWVYDTRKTAVVMEDWYKPLDPRQFYYATYNISRANMNQSAERAFVFAEERGLIEKISPEARKQIETFLLPLRHLHWGANMNMTEIAQRGYGAAVTAPCIFSAGDHLGMAQIVSRIGLLLDGQTGVSLDMAKEVWINDPAWQGVRKLIEDSLVERDFFQLFVAQTLAINGVVFDLVYKMSDAAWKDAPITVAMLTEFMSDWRADESKWSDSVIKTVAAESPENKALVSQWAAEWISRAVEAAKPLSAAMLGDNGALAEAAGDAVKARAKNLGLTL
ncbi:aromatic/alkene monooxygenase hydroxylase subunit beta [Rhodoblastus acidophilus]|uniref:Aromatic/alkene monooxygenase hydroxylase subunit beta n=1 Tax=Candidatus Rhodoblastus alkanivorans TaxID=2954117 RepID=A0ABS9Z422_9HYPH|nr:aromatic/alkene monooxygenase hydroxylase subunit beta [Candidatus Rhodoblastus alkanivorans]MDI4639671.1 aromatic/alkene monooxygenase hydroxylase subunit beta [Rhodoblastus acidophilus]MCI4680929.1 aromatic/alkene monooxygenase hydroxylase subunit beta [Candidatus Rhodoblastus alkanivorans]MCI4682368.1 aromatic/alkene monooxygenase hydroxylase subunit beta [Candidatus Rhodoblastus alkanivorans]MCI4682407.1 aromatic/alkene monooxygenase hydroxylase subunit beta [Candidatus Rhodoblastus alka